MQPCFIRSTRRRASSTRHMLIRPLSTKLWTFFPHNRLPLQRESQSMYFLNICGLDFLRSLIEYQFGQFGATNESIYGSFDARKLNQSAAAINKSLATDNPVSPGYIYATLTAYNATGTDSNTTTSGTSQSTSGDSGGSTNTGLAM